MRPFHHGVHKMRVAAELVLNYIVEQIEQQHGVMVVLLLGEEILRRREHLEEVHELYGRHDADIAHVRTDVRRDDEQALVQLPQPIDAVDDQLVHREHDQICVRASKRGQVHGQLGRERLVQRDAEFAIPAQSKQQECAEVDEAHPGRVPARIKHHKTKRHHELARIALLHDVLLDVGIVRQDLPKHDQQLPMAGDLGGASRQQRVDGLVDVREQAHERVVNHGQARPILDVTNEVLEHVVGNKLRRRALLGVPTLLLGHLWRPAGLRRDDLVLVGVALNACRRQDL
eukprot:scaffold1503_cov250-Pinguiococcus_pyrenoidosus.AAC.12